jgi:hypothetical protein
MYVLSTTDTAYPDGSSANCKITGTQRKKTRSSSFIWYRYRYLVPEKTRLTYLSDSSLIKTEAVIPCDFRTDPRQAA